MTLTIQSTGTYDKLDNSFSISFCPNDNHLITFDGLSVEDMKEIKSLIDILLDCYMEEKNNGFE